MIKRGAYLLFLIILIVMLFTSTAYSGATASFNVNLFEGGRIEAIGNISSGANQQITFLVSVSGQPASSSTIVYIDQIASASNGTFLFRFTLPESMKGKTLDFTVGGADLAAPLKKTLTIPDFPINIASIEDNSVRAGFDVYQLFSSYYTPDNVVDSIIEGGNTIYYRIGGNWYDLRDTRATTAAFLIPENSIHPDIVKVWQLDTWYPRSGFGALKFDPVQLN